MVQFQLMSILNLVRTYPGCINLFITYFTWADNMLLPGFTRGQITCYCPRQMLLPRRQVTRRKLCFDYTCKFDVISIKYVIKYFIHGNMFWVMGFVVRVRVTHFIPSLLCMATGNNFRLMRGLIKNG